MSERLEIIASLICDGRGSADVGTDHGYLPVMLCRRGYNGALIASDINSGPLEAARITAREAGFDSRISFVLCDGLSGVDPKAIDTIVIAGMGGDTITGILDRDYWCASPEFGLIMQPMLRTNVETEVTPALCGATASEEIMGFLLQGFEGDVSKIWQSNIFGKSLYDIAGEGLTAKINALPENARSKLQETLQKVINEGSGGLICIIL